MKRIGKKGSAVIEFALILPLLALIVMGVVEFGFALYDKAVLTNASREGARAGVMARSTAWGAADIETVVRAYLAANQLITLGTRSTPAISVTGVCGAPGTDLEVEVSYNYDFLVLPDLSAFFGKGLSGSIAMTANTVMHCQ